MSYNLLYTVTKYGCQYINHMELDDYYMDEFRWRLIIYYLEQV